MSDAPTKGGLPPHGTPPAVCCVGPARCGWARRAWDWLQSHKGRLHQRVGLCRRLASAKCGCLGELCWGPSNKRGGGVGLTWGGSELFMCLLGGSISWWGNSVESRPCRRVPGWVKAGRPWQHSSQHPSTVPRICPLGAKSLAPPHLPQCGSVAARELAAGLAHRRARSAVHRAALRGSDRPSQSLIVQRTSAARGHGVLAAPGGQLAAFEILSRSLQLLELKCKGRLAMAAGCDPLEDSNLCASACLSGGAS